MRTPSANIAASLTAGVVALAGVLALSACGPDVDPLTREGLWHPSHVNRANLVAMVANPADLVRGTGSATADGQLAAAAVTRLRTDKLKKLPQTDIAQGVQSGSNEAAGGGGGNSGAP
jgi:hypothetical protein